MSLIAPSQHLALMAALFAIAGAAFLLERTRVGGLLTGAVIAILGAIVAANAGLIPHAAPAYDFVFAYLVPVLIPLFLFKADLRRLVRECARLSGAFLVAAAGTVAGVAVAALCLDLGVLGAGAGLATGEREAAVVGLFASTYIGGSVNYAALGEITGLKRDASFFSAATAADNLFSALYLGLLALAPGWRWLASRFPAHREEAAGAGAAAPETVTAASLCLSLAASLGLVAVTDLLVARLGLGGGRYLVLSALALGLATAVPDLSRRLAGSFELGVALSFVFFAAIAAGADVPAMLAVAPLLIALVAILLTTHALVTALLGRALGLTLPELITASNAAVLGATTAPALAATRGWHSLVTPGVLVGVLGYALGTFVGSALFRLWAG